MDSKKTIVFIHGWGVSSEIFKTLYSLFENNFQIYDLDLPGFGKTPIEKIMTLKDYAEFVHDFLVKNEIENPTIIGHSFGGAVSAKLALLYSQNISKLVLVGASAVREPQRKMILIKKMADIVRPILSEKAKKMILKFFGYHNTDYAKIEKPELRETFKNIIKENLTSELPKIMIPTLVIWGEDDTETPLAEGKKIAQNIPGAKLVIIKNAGHFAFLKKPNEFVNLIKDFIK